MAVKQPMVETVINQSVTNELISLINKPEPVDGCLTGNLSPREPDNLNLDYNHISPITKPSPPEIVDTATMEQVISPVIDFPDYLTPEVQVKVGVSPTEEIAKMGTTSMMTTQMTTTDTTTTTVQQSEDKSDGDLVVIDNDLSADVPIETIEESMAFVNSAFEGADAIDAREELDDGAVSPFEIVRDETDKPVRASVTSPVTDSEVTYGDSEVLQDENEIMRQLESERIEYNASSEPSVGSVAISRDAVALESKEKEIVVTDVDDIFIVPTASQHQDAEKTPSPSTTIGHGSSRLHSASEIEENVVVWETTIHQHSIEMSDEVSEMATNGMKIRLEDKIKDEEPGEGEKSESTDSTELKKEARELANQIVGQVTETIKSHPLGIAESLEISDEDLVELSDEHSSDDEQQQPQQRTEDGLAGRAVYDPTQLPSEMNAKVIQDSISSEKVRVEKHETSEIIVDTNGHEYLITEVKTTEERTRSETTIKTDELIEDEPIVKMRVKSVKGSRSEDLDPFQGPGLGKEQRFSTDSDRLANLSGAGASLSSTPTSSDKRFVSCLSEYSRSPGSSRPTSSEFDHLMPSFGHGQSSPLTGPSGSEYETAATSQESSSYISARQAATSGESASYVTAKSSRESTISVDSDHSFNYTDSETSETLMTGNLGNDESRTPVPREDFSLDNKMVIQGVHLGTNKNKDDEVEGEDEDDEDDDEEEEEEDRSSTPVNYDLISSQVKEPYESEIPDDVIRSGIEIPFMTGSSSNWELIERPDHSSSSSPFEIIPITNEQMTDLLEETPEKMLGEKVSAVTGLLIDTESTETVVTTRTTTTSTGATTMSTTSTTATTTKSSGGASQGSGTDDNDQQSISDGSVTWLSSSLGTAVGIGNNSFDSSTGGGQMSDRPGGAGGPISGLTDSLNSFEALGQSSDNLGTGDAMSSLESQGHGHSSISSQVVATTTLITSSSPEMIGAVSGSEANEISDFERYDIDRSSLGDYSPGLRLPEFGRETLGGSLSSVNDINEIPSEAAATDTPLISQSSVASSILSEQARHQLSYDLSPEIPCQGSGTVGETLTMRSDDTQLCSEGDGTRPMSPIPPNDFGSNAVSSIGTYEPWEEKSPCSDDTDMCMMMTPSINDNFNGAPLPPPLLPLLSPSASSSAGLIENGSTVNLIEGITSIPSELDRIEEEEDEFGFIVNSTKFSHPSQVGSSNSDGFHSRTLGFDRSVPIPVSSIGSGHITTVIEAHEGSSTGSSLQEFEKLEAEVTAAKIGPGGKPSHHGSSDSIGSFGSVGKQPLPGKGGSQGEDNLSVNSLMEFEKLESDCKDAEVIEKAAREEAARLSEIEEGHESQASDSQETLSDQGRSDEEDAEYEKRMKEIDEMIGVTKPINNNN